MTVREILKVAQGGVEIRRWDDEVNDNIVLYKHFNFYLNFGEKKLKDILDETVEYIFPITYPLDYRSDIEMPYIVIVVA